MRCPAPDVAVRDSRVVRRRQRVGDAEQRLDRLAPCVMSGAHPIGQRAAVGQLRDEVCSGRRTRHRHVMNRDDVRMIQRGHAVCASAGSSAVRWASRARRTETDRDRAIQPGVVGRVGRRSCRLRRAPPFNPVCPQRDAGVRACSRRTRMLSHSPPTSASASHLEECLTHTVIERN